MTMMDGNIDVDGDHVEGNNEDEHCDLTCWMELVTVSRESKEFATRSIFPENIYYQKFRTYPIVQFSFNFESLSEQETL